MVPPLDLKNYLKNINNSPNKKNHLEKIKVLDQELKQSKKYTIQSKIRLKATLTKVEE